MSLPTIMDPEALARGIEALRHLAIAPDEADETIAPPLCEQYYLLAIHALESAQRFAMLAELHRRRGE